MDLSAIGFISPRRPRYAVLTAVDDRGTFLGIVSEWNADLIGLFYADLLRGYREAFQPVDWGETVINDPGEMDYSKVGAMKIFNGVNSAADQAAASQGRY
jgi:hypothetical protein